MCHKEEPIIGLLIKYSRAAVALYQLSIATLKSQFFNILTKFYQANYLHRLIT